MPIQAMSGRKHMAIKRCGDIPATTSRRNNPDLK
jgi:hypothetical protein